MTSPIDVQLKPEGGLTLHLGGSSGGLTVTQVQGIARAVVYDWAEDGNLDPIPLAKLSEAPIAADWAAVGNTDEIPLAKLARSTPMDGMSLFVNDIGGQVYLSYANQNAIPFMSYGPDVPTVSTHGALRTGALFFRFPGLNFITNDRGGNTDPVELYYRTTTEFVKVGEFQTPGGSGGSGGGLTYYDTDADPLTYDGGSVAVPTMDGQTFVNRMGRLWIAGDSITTHPSAPAITDQDWTNTYYTPDASDQDANGEFRAFSADFLQTRGTTTNIVTWDEVWVYIVNSVLDNAANRNIRDNYEYLGVFDNSTAAALSLSHHADKADDTKTFIWQRRSDHQLREVLTFTDSTPVREDHRYWYGPVLTSEEVRQLIQQYESIQSRESGYQPTKEDYDNNVIYKSGNELYEVVRDTPTTGAAEVDEWEDIPYGTGLFLNGEATAYTYRGAYHHTSDVHNPTNGQCFILVRAGQFRIRVNGQWQDKDVHSIRATAFGSGGYFGYFDSRTDAAQHIDSAHDYVVVGDSLLSAANYTAATTSYQYHAKNWRLDVPTLSPSDASLLDHLHALEPDDITVSCGLIGGTTETPTDIGWTKSGAGVGSITTDFPDEDILEVSFITGNSSVSALRHKMYMVVTEDQHAEKYAGMAIRLKTTDNDEQSVVTMVLEAHNWVSGNQRYRTTEEVPNGYRWEIDEDNDFNLQDPDGEVLGYGVPWIFHTSRDTPDPDGDSTASPTNLSITRTGTQVTVRSSTGTDAEIPAATSALAGVLTSTLWNKLNNAPTDWQAFTDQGLYRTLSGGVMRYGLSHSNLPDFNPTFTAADDDDKIIFYNDDEGAFYRMTVAQAKTRFGIGTGSSGLQSFANTNSDDRGFVITVSNGVVTISLDIENLGEVSDSSYSSADDKLAFYHDNDGSTGYITVGNFRDRLAAILSLNAARITAGVFNTARLGSGTAGAGKALVNGAWRDRVFITYSATDTYVAGDVVVLTQAQYDAISAPVAGVIYKISA